MNNPICPTCQEAYLIMSHEMIQGRSIILENCLKCGYKEWVKSYINSVN